MLQAPSQVGPPHIAASESASAPVPAPVPPTAPAPASVPGFLRDPSGPHTSRRRGTFGSVASPIPPSALDVDVDTVPVVSSSPPELQQLPASPVSPATPASPASPADLLQRLETISRIQHEQQLQHQQLHDQLAHLEALHSAQQPPTQQQQQQQQQLAVEAPRLFHDKLVLTHHQRPSTIPEESSRATTPMSAVQQPPAAHVASHASESSVALPPGTVLVPMHVDDGLKVPDAGRRRRAVWRSIPAMLSIVQMIIAFVAFCIFVARGSNKLSGIRIFCILVAVATLALEAAYLVVYIRRDQTTHLVRPRTIDLAVVITILCANFATTIMSGVGSADWGKGSRDAVRSAAYLCAAIVIITGGQLALRVREMLRANRK